MIDRGGAGRVVLGPEVAAEDRTLAEERERIGREIGAAVALGGPAFVPDRHGAGGPGAQADKAGLRVAPVLEVGPRHHERRGRSAVSRSPTYMTRSGSSKGRLRSNNALTSVKTVAFMPMPSASASDSGDGEAAVPRQQPGGETEVVEDGHGSRGGRLWKSALHSEVIRAACQCGRRARERRRGCVPSSFPDAGRWRAQDV